MMIQQLEIDQPAEPGSRLGKLLGDKLDKILQATATGTLNDALQRLITEPGENKKLLEEVLHKLSLCYLTRIKSDGTLNDPVARFHLSNGARIERINVLANSSESAINESFGCMVNYLYNPEEVISNHEAFVTHNKIMMSKSLQKEFERMQHVEV